MRYALVLVLVVSLFLSDTALAADQNAASCSFNDVNQAVTDCLSTGGGTVTIPPCPETDWGSNRISINPSVPIRIKGSGIDVTNIIGTAGSKFHIGSDDSGGGLEELCCMTIDNAGASGSSAFRYDGCQESMNFRFHHVKIQNWDSGYQVGICQNENGVAVFDHNYFDGSGSSSGYAFGSLYGPGRNGEYTIPSTTFGVNNHHAIFIEDNTFYRMTGHNVAAFTGASIVFRNNTVIGPTGSRPIDAHNFGYGQGCGQQSTDPTQHSTNFGTYQYEIYDNVFTNMNQDGCIYPRSGTGIVTDNKCDALDILRLVIESTSGKWMPQEEVIVDGDNYICIYPHVSSTDNRPSTGANWETFWIQAGSAGGTWTIGEQYTPGCRVASGCFHDVSTDYMWDYGSDGKLSHALTCYFTPNQWWIWNNDNNNVTVEGDYTGCVREGYEYFLNAPQPGDPITSYTKYTYPHPLVLASMQTCSEIGGVDCCDNIDYECPGTVYSGSSDCSGSCCSVTCTLETTPPVRSSPQPTSNFTSGTTQATLSLSTDETANCRYSTTSGVSYSSMTNTFSSTDSTSHSTQVTGLSDGGTYHYYVRCEDTKGNANPDDLEITFGVNYPDSTPPVISGVVVTPVSDSATVTWNTDEDATSRVDYGLTTGYGSVEEDLTLEQSHSITLNGLTPETTYYYEITSEDSSSNPTTQTGQFATTGVFGWMTPLSMVDSCGATSGNTADNLFDGDTESEWRHFTTTIPEMHWVILDLGESYQVSKIRLYHRQNYQSNTIAAIYISEDTVNWGSSLGDFPLLITEPTGWKEIDHTDKTGRYLRLETEITSSVKWREFDAYVEHSAQHHPADTNPQNCQISQQELLVWIDNWYTDSTTYPMWEIMAAVEYFYAGSYC